VNSIIKASVALQNFIRTWEGLFCEGAENHAANQSSHHILNYDGGGGGDDDDDNADDRQRLSRAQLLQNQLVDYFLTPAGAILSAELY
jgi:hypothetical protein